MGAQWLQILRRRWSLILAAVVVAVVTAWAAASGPTPQEQVQQGTRDQFFTANVLLLQTAELEFGNLETLSTLTTIGEVPRLAAEELGYETPADVPAEVVAEANTDTGFLTIAATGRNAAQVEGIADAYAQALIAWLQDRDASQADAMIDRITEQIDDLTQDVTELEAIATTEAGARQIVATAELEAKTRQLAALQERLQQLLTPPPDAGIAVMQPAQATQVLPDGSDFAAVVPRSRPAQLGAAALLGLLLGIGIALVVESADRRIRSREEAEEHLGLPVLAEVPRRPLRGATEEPWAVRSFGLLAAGLSSVPRVADPDAPGAAVALVTSPMPREGRTTVTEGLAAYCRAIGQTVTVLPGELQLGAATGEPEAEGSVAGPSARKVALREARASSDLVLIDAPPILMAGDAAHLLADVDTVVVVVRARRTRQEEARRTRQLLELFGFVRGFAVLNGSGEHAPATSPEQQLEPAPWSRGLSLLARHLTRP